MLLGRIFLGIVNLIKKVYLWLFNFMIGTETKKFYRAFVHAMTVLSLFIFPYVYFRGIIQLLTGYAEFHIERLPFIILSPLMPIAVACGIKLMMYMSNSDDV